MLSVTYKPFMLNVIILSVVMLSVVAPFSDCNIPIVQVIENRLIPSAAGRRGSQLLVGWTVHRRRKTPGVNGIKLFKSVTK
jgi:hypothetical protein